MFKFFRKHRSVVLVFLAACVAGLILSGIGGTSLMPSGNDTIVKVNGKNITQTMFDRIYNQMVRQQNDTSPQNRQQLMGQALNEVIRAEVFSQEAEKYGVKVTDQELQYQLSSIPAFQKEGRFDPPTYVQVIGQSFGVGPKEFEKNHRKDLAARKLNMLLSSSIHVSDDQFENEYRKALATEKDPKRLKALKDKPQDFRRSLEEKEINAVFGDWLNQLNSNLKVNIVSDRFQKSLAAPAQ